MTLPTPSARLKWTAYLRELESFDEIGDVAA
jgi:hypothetical protein